MSRPKKESTKCHITATISPESKGGIVAYQNDQKNWIKNNDGGFDKPSLSMIVEMGLEGVLGSYLKKGPVPQATQANP